MTAPTIELSAQQEAAVDKAIAWWDALNGGLPGVSPVFRLFGYAGTGKAQRHGSKVYTPDGPVNIEDLAVGDLVFGVDGKPIRVTGVYPQGVRDSYRVTFRDGTSVHCDREHLWAVQTSKMRQNGRPYKNMTTGELMAAGLKFDCGIYRFSIPLCAPVQYPARDLPIDPYVLGALIGDGTNLGSTPTLCISWQDEFIAKEVERRLPSWAVMTAGRNAHCDYHRITDPRCYHGNAVAAALRQLGLAVNSPDRAIPAEYLYASVEQRWALLRGLMDTDGSSRGNRVSFSTSSPRLASDVANLVQSLGGTAIISSRDNEHAVNVKLMTCPFLLPRKADNWRPSTKNPPSRRIVSIEPAGAAEHTCISVAAPDGLYLTDHYVVTHNTTIAQHIVSQLDGVDEADVLYAAFTGKAAYVLRQKGCTDARTIHSLIYLPTEKARQKLRELMAKLDATDDPTEQELLQKQIRIEQQRLETPSWLLRAPEETDLTAAQLLVVDEVSMVGEQMATDLLSFQVPIMVLGDPAQLPPVEGGGYFIDHEPDHLLTEIHRSALDSPVTRLATAVRGSQPGDRWYGIPGADGDSGRRDWLSMTDLLSFDQVLVGTNNTRWQAIHLLRALRGQVGDMPVTGDRIICLANNSDQGVFNGQQFAVESAVVDPKRDDRLILDVVDDEGHQRKLTTWRAGFTGLEGEKHAKREGRGGVVAATFGQAITVHKSQGSQWGRVMVVDEAGVFARIASKEKSRTRNAAGLPDRGSSAQAGHLAGQRWTYTAITRAAEQVVVVPGIRGLIR